MEQCFFQEAGSQGMKKKTSERREAILAMAKTVFQESGFDQTSMSAIAARLGSSKATLYRYFPSKEALFTELVQRSASERGNGLINFVAASHPFEQGQPLPVAAMNALGLLNPDADVASTLREVAIRIAVNFQTPASYASTRMIIAASMDQEVGRKFYQNGPALGMACFERYFASLVANGKLRAADPRVITCHFRGLIDAEINLEGLYNVLPTLDEEQMMAIVDRAVDVFMRAYGVEAAS